MLQTRRSPSRPSATRARRSGGAASTTSRAKFTGAERRTQAELQPGGKRCPSRNLSGAMARSILPGLALSAAVVATALALYVLVAGGPGPRAPGDLPDSAENGQVRLPGEPAVAAPRERSRREPAAEGAVPALAAPVPVVAFPGAVRVRAGRRRCRGRAGDVVLAARAGRAHHPPGGIDPGRGACGVAVGRADRGDAAARRGRTAGSGRAGGAGPAGALPAAERRCGAGRERVRRVAPRRPAGAVARAAGAG